VAITRFVLIVYRMPPKPTAARVAVWRLFKKVGAVYLQQAACVFPDNAKIRRELQPILGKIEVSRGSFHLLPLRSLPGPEQDKLIREFQSQSGKQFQEIIENCEINFQKEVEFETFRGNFTYEEAEEIRIEFEKIVNWYSAVAERDWFGAPNAQEARQWLDRCEHLLDAFEERVFEVQSSADTFRPSRPASRRQRGASKRGGVTG
jgi:hypothetical protein